MTDEQKTKKYKNNRKQYIENMTDEERQKYKKAKNKCGRDRYNKMTDEQKQKHQKKYKDLSEEQKQKRKDYQKQYMENITDEKKTKNKRLSKKIL